MYMKPGFGSASVLPLLWFVVYRCVGEIGMPVMPLYVSKSTFIARAAEEMDSAYAAGLDKYGTVWMFIIVVILSIVTALVSERLTEKILNKQK